MIKKRKYTIVHFLQLTGLLLLGFASASCEKDDVCIDLQTPKLVLVLYNQALPTEKLSAEHLTLVALPHHDTLQHYKDVTTDSIAIPLNVNQDACSFLWIKDGNSDQIDFSYDRVPVLTSKTCGYRTNFYQLQVNLVPDGNNWIQNIEVVRPEITTDTIQHVKIFH